VLAGVDPVASPFGVPADRIVPMAASFDSLLTHGLYAGVFIAPFVQEDAAFIGTAALSAGGHGTAWMLFAVLIVGTTCSDVWKYWAGGAAHLHPWTARMAAKPAVQKARETVVTRLFLAMLVARFVPGTRIPLYVAAGVFRAPFARFLAYVVITAIAYGAAAFALLHLLGAAAGEAAAHYAAPVALAAVTAILLVSWLRHRGRPEAQPD
jgi:membrane protein DedA with SNARE-associated domain